MIYCATVKENEISKSVVLIFHRSYTHNIRVNNVLVPGQKWVNQNYQERILIDKVSNNATFAAFYVIEQEPTTAFPIRGEFDPEGSTIGWVVSYWNTEKNYHAVGVWAGYVEMEGERAAIATTRLIAHGDSKNTTTGFDRFTLLE